jgi:hypothetical protein
VFFGRLSLTAEREKGSFGKQGTFCRKRHLKVLSARRFLFDKVV